MGKPEKGKPKGNSQKRQSQNRITFTHAPSAEDLLLTKGESDLLRTLVDWNEQSVNTLHLASTISH